MGGGPGREVTPPREGNEVVFGARGDPLLPRSGGRCGPWVSEDTAVQNPQRPSDLQEAARLLLEHARAGLTFVEPQMLTDHYSVWTFGELL